MSELKPACPNCRSLSTTFLGDVGKKNWSCDDCLCTWDQSRSAAQITPQAGEAFGYVYQKDHGNGIAELFFKKHKLTDFAGWEEIPLYCTAPPRPVCDGNHAAPACADPECWQRPSAVAPTAETIYEQIKHGDETHRAWLKEALENVFAGKPVPPPTPSPVAPGWQPIETAPRDGTAIVGWSDDLKKRAFVFWKTHHGGNYWALVGQDHFSLSNVTLWQPLSPPPDSPGAEDL